MEYFQIVESSKLKELMYIIYTMGISSAISQINGILENNESHFTFDCIHETLIKKLGSEYE